MGENSVRFEKNIGIYGQPLNAIFGNYCTERTQSPIVCLTRPYQHLPFIQKISPPSLHA